MKKETLNYIRKNLNHTSAGIASDNHTFRRYVEGRIPVGMARKEFLANNGLKEELISEEDFIEYIASLGWKRASN